MTKKSKGARHVLYYIEDCSPNLKEFATLKALNTFMAKFKKKYPSHEDGYWLDHVIYNVHGEIEMLE